MLYNPFNALSLLDFSESSRRASFVAASGLGLSFSRSRGAAEVACQRHRRKKSWSENQGVLASGVGNYVADVN